VTVRSLKAVVNRAGRRKGVARLNRALEESPGLTRSEYERRLRRICRQANLPQPRMNAIVDGYEVDAYFEQHRVVVEVNPFSTHGHKRAHEKDTRKLAELAAKGFAVLPFTGDEITEQPLYVAARIAEALAAGCREN
jgi:very-short-patch-repair endonuclease